MTAEIIYLGELRCKATHSASGNQIFSDAPIDNHGKGEAFSPTDLVATALGACLMTIMGILAERESLQLAGTKLFIQKIMASEPRRISEIVVEIQFPPIEISETQKIKLERAAKTCPVAMSLHPELFQTINFHYS